VKDTIQLDVKEEEEDLQSSDMNKNTAAIKFHCD